MIIHSVLVSSRATYSRFASRLGRSYQYYTAQTFSSSTSAKDEEEDEQPPDDSATIIQGPSLLTSTGVHRPSPSLFHLPGLRALPFWTAPGDASNKSTNQQPQQQRRHRIAFNDPIITSAVQHVESNYDDIKAEYFSAVLGQGTETNPHNNNVSKPLEPDYDISSKGGEHAEDALHSGNWDWHSYILNGVKNEKFRERCPKTAQVVDDVSEHVGSLTFAYYLCTTLYISYYTHHSFESFIYYLIIVGKREHAIWDAIWVLLLFYPAWKLVHKSTLRSNEFTFAYASSTCGTKEYIGIKFIIYT